MKRRLVRSLGPVAISFLLGAMFFGSQHASVGAKMPRNNVLARALAIELGQQKAPKWLMPLSSGVMYTLLQASGTLDARANRVSGSGPLSAAKSQGCQNVFAAGAVGGRNIRVNQDCSLRRQAEETIAINPNNPNNLVAGQNDSRIGFNHCGYDWSFDGGRTWGDQIPPYWQFQLLDGHTSDACSDPTAAFDAQGSVYAGGIVFDVASDSNAIVVAKSNAPIGGAFYHSPKAQPFQEYRDVPLGVVANDPGPDVFNDKELMTADAHPASPKANNVYMTWTRFNANTGAGVGQNSPIYFSQSTNGGDAWSPGVEISGSNSAICTIFSGEADPFACDQDQGSFPTVGPDGTVYVTFNNGNTPLPGINQFLFVKCSAGSNCSNKASWTQPVKIEDDFATQPVGPDPATGCPAGRPCLPPNGYRFHDFGANQVTVDNGGNLYFVWSDFRNGGPPCVGPAPSATPPCDQDVFFSTSIDGGATWSPKVNVAPASKVGVNAQWQPGSSVTPDGKTLWIAYYDRSYGTCEATGCNDITLAKVSSPGSSPSIKYTRVTTASMPNLVPANNPLQAGFLGDYMWVAVDSTGKPYVVWADTRGLNNTVEEDIYFATIPSA